MKGKEMNAVETQIEYAELVTEYLDDVQEGISVLDLLDALASLGLQIAPIEGENVPSVAYFSALKAAQE